MRFRWYLLFLLILTMAAPAQAATGPAMQPGGTSNTQVLTQWVFPAFDILVLSLLGLASVAGVAVAINAMINLRENKVAPAKSTNHIRRLIEDRDYKELMDFTATDTSFVSKALYAAIRRAHLKYGAMREALESSVGEQTAKMFRRIEPLNVIGNIGPLLGLLGTVLGMIMAFYDLKQNQGQVGSLGGNLAGNLAGGISTALWHTFFGLFVAIPSLVVYGFYRIKADEIATRAALVAEELLEGLRPDPTEDKAERKKSPSRESSTQTADSEIE